MSPFTCQVLVWPALKHECDRMPSTFADRSWSSKEPGVVPLNGSSPTFDTKQLQAFKFLCCVLQSKSWPFQRVALFFHIVQLLQEFALGVEAINKHCQGIQHWKGWEWGSECLDDPDQAGTCRSSLGCCPCQRHGQASTPRGAVEGHILKKLHIRLGASWELEGPIAQPWRRHTGSSFQSRNFCTGSLLHIWV